MKKIKCPECGNLTESNLTECNKCGYPFDGTEEYVEDDMNGAIKLEEKDIAEDDIEENEKEEIEKSNLNLDVNPSIKKGQLNKRTILEIIGCVILLITFICSVNLNSKNKELQDDYKTVDEKLTEAKQENMQLQEQNRELTNLYSELQNKINELENGAKKQLVDIKNAYENNKWQDVIDLASKLHEEYNGTEEDVAAQKMAKASQQKLDKIKAKKEAEKAKGYETGITYKQLARTPDKYEGKKVKFYGKVIQVIEGDDSVQIRLAVSDNYETVLLGEYSKSIVSSRVLVDDHITIYGTSVGTISYNSTMGGTITIPGVYIEKIKQ